MVNSDKNCKIYYGDGNCSLEGSETTGVILDYTGDAILNTTANNLKWVLQEENRILVLRMDGTPLTNLFSYLGTLKITRAEATDGVSLFHVTLHRIDNYSELINTNAEDLTTNSEDLSSRSSSPINKGPTSIKHPILKHQDTEHHDGKLYLANGNRYEGKFHIHTKDGSAMTGRIHTSNSQLLYYRPTINGRFINRLTPTTVREAQKIIKAEKNKMRSNKSMKRFAGRRMLSIIKRKKR